MLVATLALLSACTESEANPDASSAPTPTRAQTSPALLQNGTHPVDLNQTRFKVAPEDMPYPYTPAPPDDRTPIDGTYLRILTLEDMEGLLPFRCLRCPPYFPNAGVSTLVLYRGNYWLNHQLSGFRALGMFTVRGHRIRFFNDPWCPQDHGTYRWSDRGGVLAFELLSGTCDYEKARATDLSKTPWDRIRPCIFRIEHLWPGPVAC